LKTIFLLVSYKGPHPPSLLCEEEVPIGAFEFKTLIGSLSV